MHHEGIAATYIRMEGQNKRLFELKGAKKWFKSLKTDGGQYLSDCANFRVSLVFRYII